MYTLPLRMALGHSPNLSVTGDSHAESVRRSLVRARRGHFEDPGGALEEGIRCHEIARSAGDAALSARAIALQGVVSLHRSDLRGALALAVESDRLLDSSDDVSARVEVAAFRAQLGFFTGSYSEALSHAELAVELADASGDDDLRLFARRATCLVFGNVGVPDWRERLEELLALTIGSGDLWEEAVSRNDLACYFQKTGDLEAAEREIERALAVAHSITSANTFALAVIHSTRADIRLLADRAQDALADAERAIAFLLLNAEPNPYVLGATVRAQVQARMALGHFDDAQRAGEGALTWLGDRMPQTRSLILATLAYALREAGRIEEAYDAPR